MDKLKIYICSQLEKSPLGGGNQFLKALRSEFEKKNIYSEYAHDANIILFNSHHLPSKIIDMKKKYATKVFIHRIDGPMSLYNSPGDRRDALVNNLNKYIADGTIFQSHWSKKENIRLGLMCTDYHTVISNAPDPSLFYCKDKHKTGKKIRLISTSWSSNINKGFNIYKFIDENLDWTRYSMTFVGNTPITYKNIKHKKALPSNLLSQELRKHDIFITASQKDPCSNALIEALHCGLPSIALNDGGHPEILLKGGELFNSQEDIFIKIDMVADQIDRYKNEIEVESIDGVEEKYYSFFEKIMKADKEQNYIVKQLNYFDYLKLRLSCV